MRPSAEDMNAALVKFKADMEQVIERAKKWAEEEENDEPS
jgi:hypothetical protein